MAGHRKASDGLWLTLPLGKRSVTWAGPLPGRTGFCFGTESGGVFATDTEGRHVLWDVTAAAHLGEAVNGVAFNAGRMAVSTRSEVVVSRLPGAAGEPKVAGSGGLLVGSHGVIAGRGCSFFCPAGSGGWLELPNDPADPFGAWWTGDNLGAYFYRLASLSTDDGNSVVAVAARQHGYLAAVLGHGPLTTFYGASAESADVVDVCPMRRTGVPTGAFMLTKTGGVVTCPNVLDGPAESAGYPSVTGVGYRIVATPDLVFVLTSRGLHALHGLRTHLPSAGRVRVRKFPMEAVDIGLVGDRWLLVVLPDRVRRLDLRQLRRTLPKAELVESPVPAAVWSARAGDYRPSVSRQALVAAV